MSFTQPGFLVLLLLVPVVVTGAILAHRRRGAKWQRLVSQRLQSLLVRERSVAKRWVTFGLYTLAFALLVVSLAGPYAGFRESKEVSRGHNIMLAIDVSKSMLASDRSGSRVATARAAALDLLDRFPDDRIGVIAFSGVAWLQAPLTVDHAALSETFQQLEFQDSTNEWIPREGSDLSAPIELAIKTFKKTGHRNNALVILSDGESHEGDHEAAAEAANLAGITIFTIGIGSEEGAFIPDPSSPDKKLHDRNGNLVLSRLNKDNLTLLARRTGGLYSEGGGDAFSTNLTYAISRLEQYEKEGRDRKVPIPRFQWFLVPAMLLLMAGMLLNTSWTRTPKAAAALLIAMLLSSAPKADAGLLPRTAAEKALAAGEYQKAYHLFQDEVDESEGERRRRFQLGHGAAAYRLGIYGVASEAYTGALLSADTQVQAQAHYGLGNVQFYKGRDALTTALARGNPGDEVYRNIISQWEDAIGHFDSTLSLNPDDKKAEANREYVKERIQRLLKDRKKPDGDGGGVNPGQPDKATGSKDEIENRSEGQTGDPTVNPPTPPNNSEGTNPSNNPQEGTTPPDTPPNEDQPSPEAPNKPNSPLTRPPDGKASSKEEARRLLRENSDFHDQTVPRRIRNPRYPTKDW